jgi:hypothetical protein
VHEAYTFFAIVFFSCSLQYNLQGITFGAQGVSPKVVDFLLQQYAWANAQVSANPSDLYWQQVGTYTCAVCMRMHTYALPLYSRFFLERRPTCTEPQKAT